MTKFEYFEVELGTPNWLFANGFKEFLAVSGTSIKVITKKEYRRSYTDDWGYDKSENVTLHRGERKATKNDIEKAIRELAPFACCTQNEIAKRYKTQIAILQRRVKKTK